ncbi:hypothetical protein L7F22_007671 [Adiantum nelumboides]|nr:hypothetical protein [Adiantum nelumboides]
MISMAASAPVLGTTQDIPPPVTWTYDLPEEDEALPSVHPLIFFTGLQSPRQQVVKTPSRASSSKGLVAFGHVTVNDDKEKTLVDEQPLVSIGPKQPSTHGLVNGQDGNEQGNASGKQFPYGMPGADMGMAGFSQPFAQNRDMTESSKIRKVATFLKTNALQWWATLLNQDVVPSTWVQFKQMFAPACITNTFEVDVMIAWNQLSAVNCEFLEYIAKFWHALLPGKPNEDGFKTRCKEPQGKQFSAKGNVTSRLMVPPFKKNPFAGRHFANECSQKNSQDKDDKSDRKGKKPKPSAGLVPYLVGDEQNNATNLCRAWGNVRDQEVLVFFDARARANFISPELASKLGIRAEEMEMTGEAANGVPDLLGNSARLIRDIFWTGLGLKTGQKPVITACCNLLFFAQDRGISSREVFPTLRFCWDKFGGSYAAKILREQEPPVFGTDILFTTCSARSFCLKQDVEKDRDSFFLQHAQALKKAVKNDTSTDKVSKKDAKQEGISWPLKVARPYSGLETLASVATTEENTSDSAVTSAAVTTKHPRHRLGCSCIVCIQPPSGQGPKHKPNCDCNVCLTVKRRFQTLMLRRKKLQSERAAENAAQRNNQLLLLDSNFTGRRALESGFYKAESWQGCMPNSYSNAPSQIAEGLCSGNTVPSGFSFIRSFPVKDANSDHEQIIPSKGTQLDLNSQPDREEEMNRVGLPTSMKGLLQSAGYSLDLYLREQGLTSLFCHDQALESLENPIDDAIIPKEEECDYSLSAVVYSNSEAPKAEPSFDQAG